MQVNIHKKILKFEANSGFNLDLFSYRQRQVHHHFKSVLEGSNFYYSQSLNNEKVFGRSTSSDSDGIIVTLVQTNEIYDSNFTSTSNALKIIESLKAQSFFDKSTTHVAFLDFIGRFSRFYPVSNESSQLNSIYDLLYGSNIPLSLTWYGSSHRVILPFGNFISGPNLLNLDAFGFRVRQDLVDFSDSINIALVGGSFASSVFSLPGESFCDIIEKKLRSQYPDKQINLLNLSCPGHVQSDSFSFLVSSGILQNLDGVIWIDGLNDMRTTCPLNQLGVDRANLNIPLKFNGVQFDPNLRWECTMEQRVDPFLSYRQYISGLLSSMNINHVFILQPIVNKKLVLTTETSELLPYRSLLPFGPYQKSYSKILPYISSLACKKYNLELYMPPIITEDSPLEFWDLVHMSPTGEAQYAEYIYPIAEKLFDSICK